MRSHRVLLLPETFLGHSFWIRHELRYTIKRPWYTFPVVGRQNVVLLNRDRELPATDGSEVAALEEAVKPGFVEMTVYADAASAPSTHHAHSTNRARTHIDARCDSAMHTSHSHCARTRASVMMRVATCVPSPRDVRRSVALRTS